jgi:SpoVK/Ycf46/Vps4 family AAA+-type ATPase
MSNANFGTAVPASAPSQPGYYFEKLGDVNVWAVAGDAYTGCPGAQRELDPAFYQCKVDPRGGPYLSKMKISVDDLIELPDPVTEMLHREFVNFWGSVERVAQLGLMVKRGIILWGPPGSGKTSALQKMAQHMIREKRGVVIVVDRPDVTAHCLHMFRKVEPTRPCIVVYEDLDALVQRFGESEYLAMLDGETQISNVVNVATTNYPERLDRRFVDRPGRFDRITEVGMPSFDAKLAYLKAKAPEVDEVTQQRWAKKSDGWSIAHLRELIVATQALGEDDGETIDRLDEMQQMLANSEHANGAHRAGFGT